MAHHPQWALMQLAVLLAAWCLLAALVLSVTQILWRCSA